METTIKISLKPFMVPTRVIHDSGRAESSTFHLSEIPKETLNKMCDNFVNTVFEIANSAKDGGQTCQR